MDHIKLPSNPAFSPLRVAFLGHEYRGGSFLGYPERCGLTSNDIYETPRTGTSSEDVAAILQSWLFFGFLEELLGSKVPIEDFTYDENGRRYLTTIQLPDKIGAWVEHVWASNAEEKPTRYKMYRECWEVAELTLQKLSVENEPLLELQLSKEGHLCLGALLNYLGIAIALAYDREMPPQGHVALEDCLIDRMEEMGWCPNEIQFLRKDTDVEAFYYVSNLKRTDFRSHDGCTSERCIANQISLDFYVTQHSEKTCKGSTCRDIGTDQEEMLQILKDGYIPLVQFDHETSCTHSSMRLLSSQNVTRYVALSHVWSDGLGNNAANSLPECQLSYISEAVKALFPGSTEPIPFWIDTICFPLEPPEAYNLAMAKMRASYDDAKQVLVLDKSLQSISASLLSDEECLVRIFCSGWMRRLWTLQEANLAHKLQFQFSNCPFDIDDALERVLDWKRPRVSLDSLPNLNLNFDDEISSIVKRNRPVVSSESLPDFSAEIDEILLGVLNRYALRIPVDRAPGKGINRYFSMLRIFLRPRQSIGNRASMTITAPALQYRSTSVSTDEPLCLGTLLNLDMEKILSVSEDQRMMQVWTLLGETEDLTNGAFFAQGPKLKSERFGWAPTTVLDPLNSAIISRSIKNKATLVKDGLLFKSSGFLITWKKPLLTTFNFRDLKGDWYRVNLSEANQSSGSQIPDDRSHYPQLLGLVVQDPHENNLTLDDPIPSGAVLVAVEKQENDVIYVRIISHAVIIRLIAKDVQAHELIEQYLDRGLDHIEPILPIAPSGLWYRELEKFVAKTCGVSGRYLPPFQQWCCK